MQATAHTSFWQETSGAWAANYPTLDSSLHVDVAIIGGGITGLTAALHLRQAGRRVAVLEAGHLGDGTTGFTSAHLDATTDTPLARLVFDFGLEKEGPRSRRPIAKPSNRSNCAAGVTRIASFAAFPRISSRSPPQVWRNFRINVQRGASSVTTAGLRGKCLCRLHVWGPSKSKSKPGFTRCTTSSRWRRNSVR